MANILNVDTGYGLDLGAIYQNTKYDFSKITGSPRAMVLHFSRQGNVFVPDGLNIVCLITNGNGRYSSIGLVKYGKRNGESQFYSLGDDLEIRVTPPADGAIRGLSKTLVTKLRFNV